MKTFAVIGLGRFGAAVAEKLMTLGHSVLAIDESQQLVAQLAERVTPGLSSPMRGRRTFSGAWACRRWTVGYCHRQ